MEISEAQLHSFIALYKREFGRELTLTEAQPKALCLLHFASLCISPLEKIEESDINEVSNTSV